MPSAYTTAWTLPTYYMLCNTVEVPGNDCIYSLLYRGVIIVHIITTRHLYNRSFAHGTIVDTCQYIYMCVCATTRRHNEYEQIASRFLRKAL